MDEGLTDLARALESGDPGERADACRRAAGHEEEASWLPELIACLADPEPGVAREAAASLLRLASRERSCLEAQLTRRLASEEPADALRFGVAWVLARLAIDAASDAPEPAVRTLLECLAGPERDRRAAAVDLLSRLASSHEASRRAVAQHARLATSPRARRCAVHALRMCADSSGTAAEAVRFALQDESPDVRRAALAVLARSPGLARREEAQLLARLQSESQPALRRIAALALGAAAGPAQDPGGVRAALHDASRDPSDHHLRRTAERGLQRIAPRHAGHEPVTDRKGSGDT